jgi:hypothetical protein
MWVLIHVSRHQSPGLKTGALAATSSPGPLITFAVLQSSGFVFWS